MISITIPGYPLYKATEHGDIVSYCKPVPRVLKPQKHQLGYRIVRLVRDGFEKSHTVTVHSVVAAAFHGPRPKGYDIAHRDNDKTNNAPSNLRYTTRVDNLADSTRVWNLEWEEELKPMLSGELSATQLAHRMGVSRNTVLRAAKVLGHTDWPLKGKRSGRNQHSPKKGPTVHQHHDEVVAAMHKGEHYSSVAERFGIHRATVHRIWRQARTST